MWVVSNDISTRKRADVQLRASLAEKEVLLKEIHHRVKNNLQVISSLLNLQSNASDNPLMMSQFQDSQNRIRSMALIHERLYRSGDLAHIDFKEYLQDLTNHLVQSYQAHIRGVVLQIMIGDVHLDIDTAIPCGLLITELVSNALKHAFPIAGGHGGEICVQMCGTDNKHYELVVQDDGIGFSERLDWRNTTSLGLQLVNSLTRQLSGTVDLEAHSGTRFTIRFSRIKQNEAS